MDRLPSELLSIIFCLACTDGGTTGRSLALVSRSVREISEPYQLQSIAIHNAGDALTFIGRLENASSRGREVRELDFSNKMISTAFIYEDERRWQAIPPITRRLSWLISSPEGVPSSKRICLQWKSLRFERQLSRLRRWKTKNEIVLQNNILIHCFNTILQTTKETLHTLTVDLPKDYELPSLPSLRSLTIRVNGILRRRNMSMTINTSTLSHLTSLDLVDSWRHEPKDWHRTIIHELAPSLSYIRLHWTVAQDFVLELLGLTPEHPQDIVEQELPPTLIKLFVQMPFQWAELHDEDSGSSFRHLRPLIHFAERYPTQQIVILYLEDAHRSMEDLVAKWG